MTRSEFFKKIGLGALACVIAPEILISKPEMVSVPKSESIGIDVIKEMAKQLELVEYKPYVCFMNINGEIIDILDKKNEKIVDRYFKKMTLNSTNKEFVKFINELP